MAKDIPFIHLLRVVACIQVVALHSFYSSVPLHGIDSIFRTGVIWGCRPCVPIFFLITGFLILPPREPLADFYKKRIPKVLYPLLIWGSVYAILPYMVGIQAAGDTVKELLCVPFKNPEKIGGILWYLYVLIGIYLFVPFLNRQLFTDGKYQKIYLIIWLAASLSMLLNAYYPVALGVNPWIHSFNMLVCFSGYLGFCILGCYFRENSYRHKLNLFNKSGGVIICLMYLSLISAMYLSGKVDFALGEYMGFFLSVGTMGLTVLMFYLIRSICINTAGLFYHCVKHVSTLTFGIYLSHMLVFYLFTRPIYLRLGAAWHMQIIVILITFLLSYALTWVISKLPISKFVVGL